MLVTFVHLRDVPYHFYTRTELLRLHDYVLEHFPRHMATDAPFRRESLVLLQDSLWLLFFAASPPVRHWRPRVALRA